MHAVLITFETTRTRSELDEPFHELAAELAHVSGLLSKAWLRNGSTYGGFHVFSDRASAESYLASPLAADLFANSAFTDFEVQHFGLLDALSARTGVGAASGFIR